MRSIAPTLHRSAGGQFIAHAKALPGNPYDGHTLETVIPEIDKQIGASLARIVADRGYRGHKAPSGQKFKVYISGQRRPSPRHASCAAAPPSNQLSATPKAEHRMGRNYPAGTHGDAANACPRRRRLITSAACSNGWLSCCLPSSPHSPPRPVRDRSNRPDSVLHGRLKTLFAPFRVIRPPE